MARRQIIGGNVEAAWDLTANGKILGRLHFYPAAKEPYALYPDLEVSGLTREELLEFAGDLQYLAEHARAENRL